MEVIPETVKQFVAANIQSIDLLEILLLLRAETQKEWVAAAIGKALQLEQTRVEMRLERLLAAGLLTLRQVGTERMYRYQPATWELAEVVSELAKWYSSHRVALIELIFSNPTEQIRTYPYSVDRSEDQ